MKRILICFLTVLSGSVIAAEIPEWTMSRTLSQGDLSLAAEAGHGKALKLTTIADDAKLNAENSYAVPVKPGDTFTLEFDARSNFTRKNPARSGVFFYDAAGRRLSKAATVNCGGSPEWKHYLLKIAVPEKAVTMKVTAFNYMGAGESLFDNFILKNTGGDAIKLPNADFESAPAIAAKNKSEQPGAPAGCIWEFKVNIPARKLDTTAYIMNIRINPDIVHYDGPESIRFLHGEGKAQFTAPVPAYLSTYPNTSYWRMIHLDNLTQTLAWSQEKIEMNSGRPVNFAIPFTRRFDSYFDPFSKGPYMIRGHHYFSVYADGKLAGTAKENAFNSQISPEASFFGNARTAQTKAFRGTLFTLADLSGQFSVNVEDFRSSGVPGGWFGFKLTLTDASGAKFPVNRVSNMSVSGDGKTLDCSMLFDPWDVPQGYFTGRYGDQMPGQVEIKISLSAATPVGSKILELKKKFPVAACGDEPKVPLPLPAPDKELRLIFLNPSIFSVDPAIGPQQIKEMVDKAKRDNFNMIVCFIIGNRAWMSAPLSNPYFRLTHDKYDFFAELRKNCREAGIKLGGTVCTLPEGAEKPGGILVKHPEFGMRNSTGQIMGWLDPAVPEVRAYRVKNIVEAARKYELDDISLDYCRLSSGSSDRGAEIYREQFGKDPRTFKYGTPDYIHWFNWDSRNLTLLVREIREALKKESPKTGLSAYVQGFKYSGNDAWCDNHQPFIDWLKAGYLDIIYPTGYIYDMLQYKSWSKRQIDACKKANPRIPCLITIGVGSSHGRLETFEELLYQINAITELGGSGAAFFHWSSLDKWADELGKTRYSHPAATE